MDIANHHWHFTIKDNTFLLNQYTSNKILVQLQSTRRLYSIFTTYTYLADYMIKFNPPHRCFYEVILSTRVRKIYFDIDMKDNLDQANIIKDKLIEAIINVFYLQYKINLSIQSDILLFTSHSESKKSFHIVVDNYCVLNNHENKKFYDLCINQLPTDYHPYIDHSVYSSLQSFRIFNSTKATEYRPKKAVTHYYHFDQEINCSAYNLELNDRLFYYEVLAKSLITNTVLCTHLPAIKEQQITPMIQHTIEASKVDYVLSKIKDKFNDTFKVRSIKDNLIELDTLKPFTCLVCKSLHEHDSPYIAIFQTRSLFYCRRSNNNKNVVFCYFPKKENIQDNNTPVISNIKLDVSRLDILKML